MICGIYKITSPTGKIYVGQSVNIKKRFSKYYKLNCKSQIKLYNSFLKHTVENHIFEIIEEVESLELNNKERHYQELFNSVDNGLNCFYTETNTKPRIVSEETSKRLSEINLGRKHSDEIKLKMSKGQKGKLISEETKLKLSIANKDKEWSNERKLKYSEFIKSGRMHKSKSVICIITNKIWNTIKECALENNIPYSRLKNIFNGKRKNYTTFKLLENESI